QRSRLPRTQLAGQTDLARRRSTHGLTHQHCRTGVDLCCACLGFICKMTLFGLPEPPDRCACGCDHHKSDDIENKKRIPSSLHCGHAHCSSGVMSLRLSFEPGIESMQYRHVLSYESIDNGHHEKRCDG